MKPLISIIIPCHNAANYVDRCLKSLVSQTLGIDKLQLILVDDTSTDDTLSALQKYEQIYPESIILISYDKNLGPGGARNIGLEYADADYIGYCDIDDWVESQMYERLYEKTYVSIQGSEIPNTRYDIVYCKYTRDSSYSHVASRHDASYSFHSHNGLYWGKDELTDTGINGRFIRSFWAGIYKKDMLLNNSIFFPEGLIHEDIYWMELVSLHASNAYIVDLPLYHYEINPDSITSVNNDIRLLDRLKIETMLVEAYKERNALEYFKPDIVSEFINRFYINTIYKLFTNFEICPNVYETMHTVIYTYFPDWENYLHIYSQDPSVQYLLNLLKARDKLTDAELTEVRRRFMELQ